MCQVHLARYPCVSLLLGIILCVDAVYGLVEKLCQLRAIRRFIFSQIHFYDHSIPHKCSDGPQIFGKALLEAVEISGFQRSDSLGYLLAARIGLTLTVPCFFSQICSRRFPVFLLEALYEMGLAAKREVVGSLSIGNTRIQHGQRCIQFLIQNIAADRQSHLPMK